MMSTWFITDDINPDNFVKLLSAKFLNCEIPIFLYFPYTVF